MNKRQMLAILLIIIAIFFSFTSIIFNLALLRADTSGSQTIEQNGTEAYGTIQLIIEQPEGRRNYNEEKHTG
jgi:hypothetical protein